MTAQAKRQMDQTGPAIAGIQHGETMIRGAGFEALGFSHRQLDGLMDGSSTHDSSTGSWTG